MSTDVVAVGADADVQRPTDPRQPRPPPAAGVGPGRVVLTVGGLVGLATDLERLVHPVIDELVFGHHSDSLPAVP